MRPDSRTLAPKTALIACSELKAPSLAAGLRALGTDVIFCPVIQLREIADTGALDSALDHLNDYSWIIFTSAYGAGIFNKRAHARGLLPAAYREVALCAVGPATAEILENAGWRVTLIPKEFVAEGILSALGQRCGGLQSLAGLRILLPRAREARDILPRTLEGAGALVDVVPCYEMVLPDLERALAQSIVDHPPELLVFTSSKTVTNFVALLGQTAKDLLSEATVAVLGPITARTVSGFGKTADIIPVENSIPSLLDAIRAYYAT
jgi:uroporphyrinogen III methyltransferase / synthase